jgi:phasin family protein
MINTRQFTDASKAAVDTLFALSGQALRGVEQLTALNLGAAKTVLAELAQDAMAAASAKSPDELMKLQTAAAQSVAPKASAYLRQVQEIVTTTAEAQRATVEARFAEFQASFVEAVDGAVKNAPGSENAVALVKSAIAAANTTYEGVNKASKQVADVVAVNFTRLAEAA